MPPKYFRFKDPALTVEAVSENELRVEAKAFARNVEIRNENDDLVLEDNFFDMDPGVRILKVYRGRISGLKVRSVRDIH